VKKDKKKELIGRDSFEKKITRYNYIHCLRNCMTFFFPPKKKELFLNFSSSFTLGDLAVFCLFSFVSFVRFFYLVGEGQKITFIILLNLTSSIYRF
jgi:hypothetical protein